MAGLSSTGLTVPSLTELREAINADLQAAFGASIDLTDGSLLGQIVGIMAERYAELWELVQAVYASGDPDAATGTALEVLCALTGTVRNPAAPSEVTLTLTGANATLVPTGSRASVTGTGAEFETTADATLATLTSWAPTTAYSIGARRTNASRCYICITGGTSAGSGGPTTTAADITDGTVHWRYLGEGAAAADAAAESVEDAAIVAVSGSITNIVTPVGGWSSVINLLDADLGNAVESDAELRLRRELELTTAGSATLDAIRADILQVSGVTAVRVFHNPTDLTDADGVPPHAVEVLVTGGTDQDIRDALLDTVAAGIATHGTVTGTSTDSEGNIHTVKFSRPTLVNIYVEVVLVKDPNEYPADGDDQVKAAIVAYGDAQATGKDVVASRISAAVFGVDGVLDVTDIDIGTAPSPPNGNTIAISTRQLAVYDTSRITVATSDGTP